MDDDLQRLFRALRLPRPSGASIARAVGWRITRAGRPSGRLAGTHLPVSGTNGETLRAAFEAARQAWMSHLPESG